MDITGWNHFTTMEINPLVTQHLLLFGGPMIHSRLRHSGQLHYHGTPLDLSTLLQSLLPMYVFRGALLPPHR